MIAPKATVLLDLAERCERATGPDHLWVMAEAIIDAAFASPPSGYRGAIHRRELMIELLAAKIAEALRARSTDVQGE